MAVREIPVDVTSRLLELGDEIVANYDATANQRGITEAGRIASSIGDRFNLTPTVEYYQDNTAERFGWLGRFKDVVDTTLEWLERCGQVQQQKTEQVLRGLYNLTELGNQAQLFALLELACAFFSQEEDPFPGERQYIVDCLEDVKTQQQQINALVEQASILLKEILQQEGVDYVKGRQFDNVVREAKVQIESCSRQLNGAEQAISKLSQKMNTVKRVSRAFRAAGCAFSSYFFFKRYQESSHSSKDLLIFGGCVVGSAWLWMSLFPGRASVYYESVGKLEASHRTLREKLEDIRVRLQSTKDYRDGL